MKKTFKENRNHQIKREFGVRLHVSKPLPKYVIQTLSKMPDRVCLIINNSLLQQDEIC